MNTLWNKLLCVILSLALLINLLPVSAMALDAPVEQQSTPQHWEEDFLVETTENATQPMVTESTEESQAVIVREDVSLREEFTKHFEMSDGSYIATVYNEPVHQLVDGTWIEVDNSLTLSSAKGMAHYKTVNGLTDVSFAQNFGDKLVTMEQDDHFITWGVEATIDTLETMAVASAQLTDNLREPAQAELLPLDLSAVAAEEQKLFATKATSTIQYADALANGVDLGYTVLPSRIKESIILNSPLSIPSYSVTINTSDLLARLLDNREVEFYTEDGETVFTMWAPYMYDSASELSEDIAVELTALGNGQHIITLTPDAEWLNSPDRVYPIVIDPDVSPSRARTNIIDNTVMEGQGVQNKNLDRLYIGKKSGSRVRAYLKYNLMPTIPSGATITTATQTLYITSGTTTGATAGAYMVTGGDWSPDTITWANKPAAATVIHPSINHNNFSHYTFSCLSAVRSWYSGSTSGKNKNYGIAVQYTNETINDYNAFYSADYSVENGRPLLTIQYQIPTSTVTVSEGSTYQLSLSGVSGTISWTSNNAAVATVNTSGKLTGVKAGKATISASMGGVVQKTYTVYVIIPNGVYSIRSYAGFYLGTNGGLSNGTNACIYSHATSGMAQLRQLWKITHLANGYYNIRPLYKLDMALTAPTANIAISQNTQPDTYASTPTYFQWTISHHPTGGGYTLKYTGSNGLALKPADPGTYPGLNAQVTGYSANSTAYNWRFEAVTGIANQVLLLDTKTGASAENVIRYVEVGDTVTLDDLGIAASFVSANSRDQSITWSSLHPSVVSVNSSTGSVTGLSSGGTATIETRHVHNGVPYAKYYKVRVICPDPLAPSKIQYMRQTRITGTNWVGSNIGTSTDHSITVIKSSCSSDVFFTAVDNINGQATRSYAINSELKSQLNALEAGYQEGYNVIPGLDQSTDNEKAAHGAKGETDQLVQAGYFSENSDEYYGVWAYNYVSECNLGDLWGTIIETATQYYNVYLSVSAFYYSWQVTTNTNSVYISASQYDDVAAYVDDIDDIANGFSFSEKVTISAEERNLALSQQGYTQPLPYKPNTPVVAGKVSDCSSNVYVRVYTEGVTSQNGRWFMRYSDIQGLTAKQIQGKFALPDTPTHYSFVTVPAGKTVYVGVVNESTTSAIQLEILERAEISWYGQSIPLP